MLGSSLMHGRVRGVLRTGRATGDLHELRVCAAFSALLEHLILPSGLRFALI
jgi:hypothetical protein